MFSAPAAPAPTAMQIERGDGEHRVHAAGRGHEPDQRGEHHEEHHPRLHQREIFGDVTALGARATPRVRVQRRLQPSLLTQEAKVASPASVLATVPITMRLPRRFII